MQQWMPLLAEHDIGKVLEHEPLSKYTTWKIGGLRMHLSSRIPKSSWQEF